MSLMTPREFWLLQAGNGLLAEQLKERVNVLGGDLRADGGICMIGLELELYAYFIAGF